MIKKNKYNNNKYNAKIDVTFVKLPNMYWILKLKMKDLKQANSICLTDRKISTDSQKIGQILYSILQSAPSFFFVMCTNWKSLLKKKVVKKMPKLKGVKYNTFMRMERPNKFVRQSNVHVVNPHETNKHLFGIRRCIFRHYKSKTLIFYNQVRRLI